MRTAILVFVGAMFLVAAAPGLADDSVTIRISVESRNQLDKISRLVSIDSVRNGMVEAVAYPADLERLREAFI